MNIHTKVNAAFRRRKRELPLETCFAELAAACFTTAPIAIFYIIIILIESERNRRKKR